MAVDHVIAAITDEGAQCAVGANQIISAEDFGWDAQLPGLLGKFAIPKADKLGGDLFVELLQQGEDVGLGPACVAAGD